jgi:predicted exporter
MNATGPVFRRPGAVRALLVLAGALAVAWLATRDWSAQLSTDVLDLVPTDERDPDLALARRFAQERQARVLLCALAGGEATGAAFAAALRAPSAIAEAMPLADPEPRDAFGRFVFERRMELLLPAWLAAHEGLDAAEAARRTVARLEVFLASDEAMVLGETVPADPLLLTADFVLAAQSLAPAAAPPGWTLVWARAAESPFSEAGQGPVFAALESAHAAVGAPAWAWTGVNRFAAESKRRIRTEIALLNLLSLAAVLTVVVAFLGRAKAVGHLVPPVGLALLAAWVATTAAFSRLHVLVFVVGSLLIGVAVDYAFHLHVTPRTAGEDRAAKFRRLRRPLLTSCLTTAIGFSLLLGADLPLLRHLGVFVSAGLLAALAAAWLYLGQLGGTEPAVRAWASRELAPRSTAWRRALLLAGAAVAAVGPWRLEWRDDIRELEVPAPELQANDLRVRALFGETPERATYLARGTTPAEARTVLARLAAWQEAVQPGSALASVGFALPTPQDWAAAPRRREALTAFPEALGAALEASGYDAESFAAFGAAWAAAPLDGRAESFDALAHALQAHLAGPLGLLARIEADESWFFVVGESRAVGPPPAEAGAVSLNQLRDLNELFARYRATALRLSLLGLGLVGASVLVLYGPQRGGRIFAVPLGACFFAFGVLGLAGVPLNLFHLLGALLGVCLSHDYAIFTAEVETPGGAVPVSVRVSALTTAASFGVLALSRIPVVSALGLTVALIVLAALAAIELRWLRR